MGTLVESQIEASLDALRRRDGPAAEKVRAQDQYLNELFKQIREQIAESLIVQLVDLIVDSEDGLSLLSVFLIERLQGGVHHTARDLGHP